MLKLNLRQRLRSSHVKRWHIVETTKTQTVAEHSFNVALIAEEIAGLLKEDVWIDDIIQYAIHHDVPEVGLGDLPTSLKHVFGREELDKVEELSKEMDPESYTNYDTVKLIVKLADLMDSIIFLAQHGVGTHAKMVRGKIITEASRVIGEFMEPHQGILSDMLVDITRWDTSDDTREGVLWNQ